MASLSIELFSMGIFKIIILFFQLKGDMRYLQNFAPKKKKGKNERNQAGSYKSIAGSDFLQKVIKQTLCIGNENPWNRNLVPYRESLGNCMHLWPVSTSCW